MTPELKRMNGQTPPPNIRKRTAPQLGWGKTRLLFIAVVAFFAAAQYLFGQCEEKKGLARRVCQAAQAGQHAIALPNPVNLANIAQEEAFKSFVNNTLPLKLDANSKIAYRVTSSLPGGPFCPRPLELTAENLVNPLPPGDYTLPILAFCTEYSTHRGAPGVAYTTLAPVEGKNAEAISTLLWRGVFSGNSPQQLQAVAWGIQSGLTYNEMPDSFKRVIDSLIPDYKGQLSGNVLQQIQGRYDDVSKQFRKLPPFDDLMHRIGKAGALTLDARQQDNILRQKNTSDQIKEQNLIAGQGQDGPAVTAQETPWSIMMPNVAYMRFIVAGGNMARDNRLEIRILAQAQPRAMLLPASAYLLNAQFPASIPVSAPSLMQLLGVRLSSAAAGALKARFATPLTAAACAGAITAAGVIAYPNAATQTLIAVLALPLTAEQMLMQSLVSYMTSGPGNKNNSGSNSGGTQVTSKRLWWDEEGNSVDVENPNPSQRPGQIHLEDSSGNKYIYNPSTGLFNGAPNRVNRLVDNPAVRSAINKGLRILGL